MRRSVHRLHRALPTLYINKLEILNGKITLTLKHPEKSHSKSLLLDNSTDEIFYQGEKKIRRAINESNLSKKFGESERDSAAVVDGKFWPSVLQVFITVNRKSSNIVNEIQKNLNPQKDKIDR